MIFKFSISPSFHLQFSTWFSIKYSSLMIILFHLHYIHCPSEFVDLNYINNILLYLIAFCIHSFQIKGHIFSLVYFSILFPALFFSSFLFQIRMCEEYNNIKIILGSSSHIFQPCFYLQLYSNSECLRNTII